jgi:hypothetical protein
MDIYTTSNSYLKLECVKVENGYEAELVCYDRSTDEVVWRRMQHITGNTVEETIEAYKDFTADLIEILKPFGLEPLKYTI